MERLKLLQGDPLINEFDISVKEPETVSRFLGNFSYKTTQMFRDVNFKVFKKLLYKSKLTTITIDIDLMLSMKRKHFWLSTNETLSKC